MALTMGETLGRALGELREEPAGFRVRASAGETVVVDSVRARYVWEPRRVVSVYAVPVADIAGRLVAVEGDGGRIEPVAETLPPVLTPRNPFEVHSTAGTVYDIEAEDATLPGAAFVPDDPDLEGYALLDWEAFTTWWEEDEVAVGHPREPFHRVRTLPSDRHVVVSIGGVQVADSRRPVLLVETGLPPRWYLPREDVRMDLLERSESRTTCAYKGFASYYSYPGSLEGAGSTRLDDIVWTYEDPRRDAEGVRDLLCFYAEATDTVVDGDAGSRPETEWSKERT